MSSTEAPFSANTRINVMGHDVQFTVRADNASEFQLRWAELAEGMALLTESVQLTIAASNAAPLTQPVATPPQPAVGNGGWAQPAQPAPQASPPAAFSAAVVPSCAHGPRNAVSKVGQKGPWKAFMCSAPQGAQKCDPIWVQRNSPEWDSFPG